MLEQAVRQADVLRDAARRPWPLPSRHWLLAQTVEDQLFAHWPVDPERMQDFVPGLEVDTFDGRAWLGLTTFTVSGLRAAGAPPLPGISSFAQVNVRTYVKAGGRPGVHFLSLDAASRLVVAAAQRLYRLPYRHARIARRRDGNWVRFESERRGGRLRVRYRPTGPAAAPAPETLEEFLTERFCLYLVGANGALTRAEIHHAPWSLQAAEAEFHGNTLTPPGLLLAGEPHVRYSARQDLLLWTPETV